MANLVLTTSAGSVTFLDAPVGFTGTAGAYWLGRAGLGNRVHDTQQRPAPGQDGVAVTRHGFRARGLDNIEVVYVGNSPSTCWGLFNTDDNALDGLACSVAFGGLTIPACEVERFEVTRGPKATSQNGMYRLHAMLSLKQLRLS